MWEIGGGGNGGGKAYAEIARQLQKARTLTYKGVVENPVEGMPDMTMEMAFKEPGLMRMSMGEASVSIIHVRERKGITILSDSQQYIEMDFSGQVENPESDKISMVEGFRSLPELADEELGEKEVGGKACEGFVTRAREIAVLFAPGDMRFGIEPQIKPGREE